MPRYSHLSDWLTWLETLHPQAIDLGLSRIYQVAKRLQLLQPATAISHTESGALAIDNSYAFTVAGTNGKGSCVTTIEQSLLSQGYSVGSYTSPHLHDYCERIAINGKPISQALVCEAFAAIDQARGDISLTYFEFGTLAALWIFVQQQIPFVILEVGLGGRLDAVNIVDADIAIVTSIAVDHEQWLGNDRNKIAQEKLGVVRATKPVIIAENDLTQSLQDIAINHTGPVHTIAHQFLLENTSDNRCHWYPCSNHQAIQLPIPELPLNSVVAGLQALYVSELLPALDHLPAIVAHLQLAGRYQCLTFQGRYIIFDVAHNPAAAQVLYQRLQANKTAPQQTLAVFAAMKDKALDDIIQPLCQAVDHWYVGAMATVDRAAEVEPITQVLTQHQQEHTVANDIELAFDQALNDSKEHDRIVVFGSFFTVALIQQHLRAI